MPRLLLRVKVIFKVIKMKIGQSRKLSKFKKIYNIQIFSVTT